MRRVNVFLAILIASLASLITLTAVGFAVFSGSQYSSSWMGDMWGSMGGGMGGMMGGASQGSVQNPALSYFGVLFVVLIGVTVVGVGGLAYFVAFPEIRTGVVPVACEPVAQESAGVAQSSKVECAPFESVVKTLSVEERNVVEVLAAHEGKYLQKYIRKETGLSRLKTHRIVARLAERGIVSLEKVGNTNQVFLADWLTQKA
jgi:hypothetical protein